VRREASASAVTPREVERIKGHPLRSVPNTDNSDSYAAATTSHALFVLPSRRGHGFQASIRGHMLELADPSSGHALAPTPDDLLIASIASDFAWSARRFLRAQGLPDDVSVSAEWRTRDSHPRVADISVTLTVPEIVETISDALMSALEERAAARSLDGPLRVHLRCEG
jgi:putative redox protein